MCRHYYLKGLNWKAVFPPGRMKVNILVYMLFILIMFCCCGCEGLRFAPSETQKQNAWLHNRTANMIVDKAKEQQITPKLQALTELNELQSRAFMTYCGLPKDLIKVDSAEDILKQSNFELANAAIAESSARPDSWDVADSAFEFGIGICALFGGIYGTRVARFLKDARVKSQALKEIITGNELFKKQNSGITAAFKKAHAAQSSTTREIVAAIKGKTSHNLLSTKGLNELEIAPNMVKYQ